MIRLVVALSIALGAATGCHTGKKPELRVLGVQDAPSSHVFVQVTNPARRPMKLTRLEYVFASDGKPVSQGEMRLYREVPAGAVVLLEVPLEADTTTTLTLRGTLTAELDQMVRSFKLDAEIQPH
jgi:hypothetical protein